RGEDPQPTTQASVTNAIQQQSPNLYLQTENLGLPADESAPGGVELGYLSDVSLQLGTQLATRIRILDSTGTVVLDSLASSPDNLLGYNLTHEALVIKALAGQSASRTHTEDGRRMMDVILPVEQDGRLIGMIYLSQPLDDVTAVLDDLRYRLMISMAVTAVMSGLIGLILSQAITRPIRRLTRAASAVAQGNLEQEVPIHSRDELGTLSRAFNNMTARLGEARQMQINFVANVSHELRTPLTSIKGFIETLRGGAVDDLGVRDTFLATVETETDRLIRLVNDLLLLSHLDSEVLTLRREPVNLAELVAQKIDQCGMQYSQRFVMEPRVNESPLLAWGDRDRIAQIVFNLLDNAAKYSPPESLVSVTIDRGPGSDEITVQVQDHGIGIPAKDLPYMGQRFYRADKARARAHGGSGLGLAIAQSLVQAQSGRLWIVSQEGAGTTVSFTLPSV
ncbi:MAG: HAMP domain-containing protein, partial [Chloroflexi bacterium]|nr:HAMP domain-containing protein [Chloroflexota bacterium]